MEKVSLDQAEIEMYRRLGYTILRNLILRRLLTSMFVVL